MPSLPERDIPFLCPKCPNGYLHVDRGVITCDECDYRRVREGVKDPEGSKKEDAQ